MDARQRRLSEASAIVFVLLCCIPAGLTEELQPVQPIPLAVQNGCCECVLPTPQADSKYLLILGSLSRDEAVPSATKVDRPRAMRAMLTLRAPDTLLNAPRSSAARRFASRDSPQSNVHPVLVAPALRPGEGFRTLMSPAPAARRIV